MKRLIIHDAQPPGDVVVLTAAIRDLHRCYPGQFITDVRTPFPELWENNPYIVELDDDDPSVEHINCDCPLINNSNQIPIHYLTGILQFFNQRLELNIMPTAFQGDIHLSHDELVSESPIKTKGGDELPFWIVVSGGKRDFTVKWWDFRRYQKVIDHFEGRVQFVQVGRAEDVHFPLSGAIDLRGKTSLRELIRLVYHASGVLCPVTLLMHLAAAVPMRTFDPDRRLLGSLNTQINPRPAVVVAGGREPPHWESYPHHHFLHTVGVLDCCRRGGCWKYRTLPLHDGDHRDLPPHLCSDVIEGQPHCMQLITPEAVIGTIEMVVEGGLCKHDTGASKAAMCLSSQPIDASFSPSTGPSRNRHLRTNEPPDPDDNPSIMLLPVRSETGTMVPLALQEAEEVLKRVVPFGACGPFKGRGIVICGGGPTYYPCAWVCINLLRHLGCTLPVELWHLGEAEIDATMTELLLPLAAKCVDATSFLRDYPVRLLSGWQLKPYSILHSSFQEVLLLDADNTPVLDPTYLFDSAEYRSTGAVFWPDFGRIGPRRAIWDLCGVGYRDEPEFESGQILVDKERCWSSLQLAMWYNNNSDFFYDYIHGDKDTYHMAFRKTGQRYSMPKAPVISLDYFTMCQHDFKGDRVFQHRNNRGRWKLWKKNVQVNDFIHEQICFEYLSTLRRLAFGSKILSGQALNECAI